MPGHTVSNPQRGRWGSVQSSHVSPWGSSGAVINEKQGVLVPFGHGPIPKFTGEAVILSTALCNVFNLCTWMGCEDFSSFY